jgi:(p)ppGpp synthase/HD superfamily hydrolase
MIDQTLYERAKEFAHEQHARVNQMYHDKPYVWHLDMVVEVAVHYIHLIPEEDREEVMAGCRVHDTIEDTGITYNDVKKATNEVVAEYAFALQNEKGRTRKERAPAKYYEEMKAYKHAAFIKLCDRLANAKFSQSVGSKMYKTY